MKSVISRLGNPNRRALREWFCGLNCIWWEPLRVDALFIPVWMESDAILEDCFVLFQVAWNCRESGCRIYTHSISCPVTQVGILNDFEISFLQDSHDILVPKVHATLVIMPHNPFPESDKQVVTGFSPVSCEASVLASVASPGASQSSKKCNEEKHELLSKLLSGKQVNSVQLNSNDGSQTASMHPKSCCNVSEF